MFYTGLMLCATGLVLYCQHRIFSKDCTRDEGFAALACMAYWYITMALTIAADPRNH